MPDATPSVELTSVVKAADDQVASDLAGEIVLLSLRTGRYYGLDAVGGRIWQLVQTPARVTDLRDAIMQEYEVDQARCERDLLRLLEGLCREGLIRVGDDSTLA